MPRPLASFLAAAVLLALPLASARAQTASPEVVAEIRIHGNYRTPDDEVLKLAGIAVGSAARGRLNRGGRRPAAPQRPVRGRRRPQALSLARRHDAGRRHHRRHRAPGRRKGRRHARPDEAGAERAHGVAVAGVRGRLRLHRGRPAELRQRARQGRAHRRAADRGLDAPGGHRSRQDAADAARRRAFTAATRSSAARIPATTRATCATTFWVEGSRQFGARAERRPRAGWADVSFGDVRRPADHVRRPRLGGHPRQHRRSRGTRSTRAPGGRHSRRTPASTVNRYTLDGQAYLGLVGIERAGDPGADGHGGRAAARLRTRAGRRLRVAARIQGRRVHRRQRGDGLASSSACRFTRRSAWARPASWCSATRAPRTSTA